MSASAGVRRVAAVCILGVICAALATADLRERTMVPPPVPPQADPQRPSEWVYETVADLSGDTSSDPPIDGLLSIATSPEGDRLYSLQVATGDHALILRSFPYDAGTRLAPSDGRVVFRLDHPFVHAGGSIAVLESGDLVVSVGAFERPGEARGLQNPDGSILRVPESIARDPGSLPWTPGVSDVVARGLRNPWRISVDLPTGDLWIGDVGEGSYEEVNVVRADQFDDVTNFGWPYREGPDSRPGMPASVPVPLTDPAYARSRQDHLSSAVIGGAVYRGRKLPSLVGKYLFSDLSDPAIRAFYPADTEAIFDAPVVTQLNEDRVISFGQLRDGEVAVLTSGGHVYEMVADNSASEGVTTRYLFDVWPAPPMNVISEGTAVIPDPKGPGFLSAELRGRIHRIIPRTVAQRWCGYDLSDVPQWNNDDPADLEHQVGELRRLLDERRDDFPAWIGASVDTARRAAQRMVDLASTDGWGSEPVERFLEEAGIERGTFAEAQRAVSTITAYRDSFCPS